MNSRQRAINRAGLAADIDRLTRDIQERAAAQLPVPQVMLDRLSARVKRYNKLTMKHRP